MFRNIRYYTVLLLKVFGLVSISTMGASILHWLRLVVVAVSNHFMLSVFCGMIWRLKTADVRCWKCYVPSPRSDVNIKRLLHLTVKTRLCRFFVLKVTALVPLAPSMAMPRNIPNTALGGGKTTTLCIHAGPILLIYKPEK